VYHFKGPLRSTNAWQRDNLQYPRHQNCAIQILETMERNGVMPDEELGILVVKIFGDWTHAVRKVKRQLYWMPKFKNANPYAVPY
jgi:signaling intermediate in Toll pathway protein